MAYMEKLPIDDRQLEKELGGVYEIALSQSRFLFISTPMGSVRSRALKSIELVFNVHSYPSQYQTTLKTISTSLHLLSLVFL